MWCHFHNWRDDSTWEQAHDTLRRHVQTSVGKEVDPSAGSLHRQSVKTTGTPGPRGFNAGKQVKGRKHHLLVDTLGLIHGPVVHPADVQVCFPETVAGPCPKSTAGAKLVLEPLKERMPHLQRV